MYEFRNTKKGIILQDCREGRKDFCSSRFYGNKCEIARVNSLNVICKNKKEITKM